jgi:hypothetical protein
MRIIVKQLDSIEDPRESIDREIVTPILANKECFGLGFSARGAGTGGASKKPRNQCTK